MRGTSSHDLVTRQSLSPVPSTLRSTKRQRKNPAVEVLGVIKKKLNEPSNTEDYFDYIGKTWASKLRNLPNNVQIIAEKAVNDIFF